MSQQPVDRTGGATASRGSSSARLTLALAMAWLPLVVLLAVGQELLPRLPGETAIHFGAGGAADGFAASGAFWGWSLAIGAAVVLALTVVALLPAVRRAPAFAPLATVMAAWCSALALGMWWSSAVVTLRAPSPREAVLDGGALLLVMLATFAWAGLAWLVHGRAAAPAVGAVGAAEEGGDAVVIEGTATAPDAFSTTVRSRALLWLGGVVVAIGVAIAVIPLAVPDAREPLAIVLLTCVVTVGSGVAVLALGWLEVSADGRGLLLTSVLMRVPVKRIAPERIAQVANQIVEPGEWGGWGYRVMPGRSALVLRRGPGVVVTLTDGRLFAVTTDEAAPLADALASQLAAAGRRP